MMRMTPALARVLVEQRHAEAARPRKRRRSLPDAAPSEAVSRAKVPRHRRTLGLMVRLVPRTGVRVHTH